MSWHGPANRHNVVPYEGTQMEQLDTAVEYLEQAIESDEGDTLFLWTGGKEANIIADLLLYDLGPIKGVSPIPFGVIETGNEFDEIVEFREEYISASGDQGAHTVGPKTGIEAIHVRRYDDLIEHVIENPTDPRGYHGHHSGVWRCPDCEQPADLDTTRNQINCETCGSSDLHPVQQQYTSPEEWGVPESCGALKVVPMKRFIEEDGYTTLITGVRSSDPIAHADNSDGVDHVVEKRDPIPHTRINPLAEWETENVTAYIKSESVSLSSLYREGYQHTDAECCTDDQQVGEHGEGGRDPEKESAREKLEAMGYV